MTEVIQMNEFESIRQEEKEKCKKRLQSRDDRIKKMKDKIYELENLSIQNEILDKDDDSEKFIEKLEERNSFLKDSQNDLYEKLNLVSKILSVNVESNEEIEKLKLLLRGKNIDLLNNTSLMKLNDICAELEHLINFPLMYHKNIIAVGGGFSSGKSAFISSFFDDTEIDLPIGINPMTAIPTYIASSNNREIRGYSYNGGNISIDKKMYAKLSHDFITTFEFNLKKIMPYMSISVPLKGYKMEYKNLCFIDTPGYDPANTGTTDEDIEISRMYISNASSLIWLVGLDANGTIPASDINFLKNIDLENKKLYIVANKADLKPAEDVNCIMNQISKDLVEHSIPICGIGAFSSNTKTGYKKFINLRLSSFLKEENAYKQDAIKNNILDRIHNIIENEKELVKEEIKKIKKVSSALQTLHLDMISKNLDDLKLDKIKHFFNSEKIYNDKLKQFDNFRNKLYEQVEDILIYLDDK